MTNEILVHISTPATRQNDDLYRSLADAYLDFEPQRRHGQESERTITGLEVSSGPRLENNVAPTETSVLSTSRESYGSFPSYVSSGGHTEVEQQSTEDVPIPTSSRLARLDRIHKLWKEKTTPKSSFINGDGASRLLDTTKHTNSAFIEDTQLGAQALQSQLQDSCSTTDEDTSADEAEPDLAPLLASSLLTIETATKNTMFNTDASTQAGPKLALSKISANQRLPRTQGQLRPIIQSPIKKRKIDELPTESYDFSKLPVDAFAPAPRMSTERPGKLPSQVTKHLAALKTQNPKRFKLSKRYGTPRYDDRGHWSVDSSSWPAKTQQEFWNSMYEHVASGRLGWGVTLFRDATSSNTLGRVRLYCWAEVVEHTWLLLWLCSNGEVVESGSKWIDADGKVMFEVA